MQEVVKDGKPILQMKISEYAKRVNLVESAVTKQIRKGLLPAGVIAISWGRSYIIEVDL